MAMTMATATVVAAAIGTAALQGMAQVIAACTLTTSATKETSYTFFGAA